MRTYWFEDEEEDEEEPRYSNIIFEEEYEEDDPPKGFEGLEKGSTIDEAPPQDDIKPWDPCEFFFIIV